MRDLLSIIVTQEQGQEGGSLLWHLPYLRFGVCALVVGLVAAERLFFP